MLGASANEIGLALFLAAIVMIAPKVGKIGAALGGVLAGGDAAQDEGDPGDDDAGGDSAPEPRDG